MFIMNIRAIDEIQKEREIQKKTVVFTHTPQLILRVVIIVVLWSNV